MKKALLVFALVIAIAVVAEGADWKLIGESQTDNVLYYDVSSIKEIKPGIVRVWEKLVWSTNNPSNVPSKNPSGKVIDTHITLSLYDCSKGKNKILQITTYYVDGTNERFSYNDDKWRYIIPDSLEEAAYKLYCDT